MTNASDFVMAAPAYMRFTSSLWRRPHDPSIHADVTVPAEGILDLLAKLESHGYRVTPSAILMRAAGYAHECFPELNVAYRWGRFRARSEKDAWLYLSDAEGRVAGRQFTDLHRKDLVTIQNEIDAVHHARSPGTRKHLRRFYRIFNFLPSWVLRFLVRIFGLAVHELRIPVHRIGIGGQGWGPLGISNLGSLGLETAPALPIAPLMRHIIFLSAGKIHLAPTVMEGRVVAAPVFPITATLDHRAFVGAKAVRLAHAFQKGLTDPEILRSYLPQHLRSEPEPESSKLENRRNGEGREHAWDARPTIRQDTI